MLSGTRSQITGPAAVAASNGTGRIVPTVVSVERRGGLAGVPGATGPIIQALRPRKLTAREPRRTLEPRIQSSRWSWLARPWRTQGRRATSAQQFLRIETHLHKMSERQKGESGVSELLAAANAATQALVDKLASVVPDMGPRLASMAHRQWATVTMLR